MNVPARSCCNGGRSTVRRRTAGDLLGEPGTPNAPRLRPCPRHACQHGNLRTLLELDQVGFCATPGLGPAKFVQLQAVLELARRHLEETLHRSDPIQSTADTRRYLMARMRHHQSEVCLPACFWILNTGLFSTRNCFSARLTVPPFTHAK